MPTADPAQLLQSIFQNQQPNSPHQKTNLLRMNILNCFRLA
ncbi:MAG: hypothetical protein ACI9UQ_000083 [Candidatus Krumholzibacteriia bacterium]|jgi:hypothetical protein